MNLPILCNNKSAAGRTGNLPITSSQVETAGKVVEAISDALIKIGTSGKNIGKAMQSAAKYIPK